MAAPAATAPPPASPWLFGRGVDLLCGCGIGYILSVPLLILVSEMTGQAAWPTMAVVILSLIVSGPHYGATLLRVYEQREDRRKYAFFAVWVTLFVAAVFILALRNVLLASLMLTLYVSWAPWHFAGQNYGLALMFLRRRGVPISASLKRLIYASFVLSFGLTFIAIHASDGHLVWVPGSVDVAKTPTLLRIGIPTVVAGPLTLVLGASYLFTLGAAAVQLLRETTLRNLTPVITLVVMQAMWFSVPSLILITSGNPLASLAFAAFWLSIAHSAQYLWVTAYYARRAQPGTGLPVYLTKTLLAGGAVTVLPGLIFAPHLLGSMPWDAGLAVLVFSVVNVHHFILDGAIWKLRDGRVARVLLRGGSGPSETVVPTTPERSWVRPLVWAVGAVCIAIPFIELWERNVAYVRAGDDAERLGGVARRLTWIGRDNPTVRANLGRLYVNAGEAERAVELFEITLRLRPGWDTAPNTSMWTTVANNLAWIRATHEDESIRDPTQAVELAEATASATRYREASALDTLAAAYAAAGRFDLATETAKKARGLALASDDRALAERIAARMALYATGKPYRAQRPAAARTRR